MSLNSQARMRIPTLALQREICGMRIMLCNFQHRKTYGVSQAKRWLGLFEQVLSVS